MATAEHSLCWLTTVAIVVQICSWILAKKKKNKKNKKNKKRHNSLEDKTRSRSEPNIWYTVYLQTEYA